METFQPASDYAISQFVSNSKNAANLFQNSDSKVPPTHLDANKGSFEAS